MEHPRCQVSNYAIDAAIAFIDYCVDRYGQCPPYINPMQCNFGAVVHHVDEAFYEQYYNGANITTQIREHLQHWH